MNMTYEVDYKLPKERIWHQHGVSSIQEARNPPPLSKKQAEEIAEKYKADGYDTMIGSNAVLIDI